MLSRRKVLLATAAGGGALALAACSTAQIQQAQADWATLVGEIQAAVAAGAKYVPTIESIAATAASLFGPTYTAIVVAGSAALNQVIAVLENVVNNLTPPASARLKAKLKGTSLSAPVVIGTTPQGVTVTGFAV
jgi:hypothetical protein